MDHIEKVGAIGVPGYGWEVKIVDEQLQPVPQGNVGELCVKGPGVMVCYYHNPEATAEVLKDGWLRTGDMARQDEDGFIFLVDRKKDVIISGGENLYPVQIEDFLSAYPKVHDVAVIGLPDARLGEIAAAIIQVKQGMTCTGTSAPGRSSLPTSPAIPPARSKSPSCGRNTAAYAWWRRRTRAEPPSCPSFSAARTNLVRAVFLHSRTGRKRAVRFSCIFLRFFVFF